jgi:hypothetical protein
MRYIAGKCDLVATHEKSSARQDLVEQQLHDFRVHLIWTFLINKRDYHKNKVVYSSIKLNMRKIGPYS